MPTLVSIRRDMVFNKDLKQLLSMLGAVAAQNYYKLEYTKKKRFKEFMEAFSSLFEVLNLSKVSHAMLYSKSESKALIVITSNFGFMGGLNRSIVTKAIEDVDAKYFVVGEKGVELFKTMGKPCDVIEGQEPVSKTVVKDGKDLKEEILEIDYNFAVSLAEKAIDLIRSGEASKVYVMYAKPESFGKRDVKCVQVLPCCEAMPMDMIKVRNAAVGRELIVDSDYNEMVEYMVKMWTISKIMEILEDSKMAEFSARGISLSGAEKNLEENGEKLRKLYHDTRKEMIDKQNREIFSAVKVSRNKKAKKLKAKKLKDYKKVLQKMNNPL